MILERCRCLADIVAAARISLLDFCFGAGVFGFAGVAGALCGGLPGLLGTRQAVAVERLHELPQLGGFHAVDAPSQAVDPACVIDNNKVAPIPLGEDVAALFKRRLEGLGPVACLKCRGNLFLNLLANDAGSLLLPQLGARRRPVGGFTPSCS